MIHVVNCLMLLVQTLRSHTILKILILAFCIAGCQYNKLPGPEESLSGFIQPIQVVAAGEPRITPVHPDSLTTFLIEGETFYTELPVVTPSNTNIHPVGASRLVLMPDSLPVTTPGKDGVPLPQTQAVSGRIVKARHPKPVNALPPTSKDNAVINIQYLDQDKGLSASTILTIEEDKVGNLWFGTAGGGLSRYDGSRFFQYTEEEGLASMQVFDILKDRQGSLWLANADGGGVTKYDGTTFTHFAEQEGLATSVVYDILEDKQGRIWMATDNAGVVMYDGDSFTYYTEKEGLPDNTVFSMLEDSRGHLWFGTEEGGLTRFDGVRFTYFPDLKEFSNTLILPKLEDRQRNLWFTSTSGYLLKYDGKEFWAFPSVQDWKSHIFLSIVEDSQGELWMGTNGAGICHFDERHFTYYYTEGGLGSNYIQTVELDSRGTIWMGTEGGGVLKLNPGGFQQMGSGQALGGNSIRTILEHSSGDLWMGNQAGEIIKYDGDQFSRYTLKKGRDRRVISAIEDHQGDIWISSFGDGLLRIDPQGGNAALKGTQYARSQGLPSHDAELLMEDRKGNIWMGTFEGGLLKFDGQFFTHFTTEDGLGNNSVISLLEDRNGTLWFGTYGGGVTRFDGEQFAVFTEAEGLSHNIVRTIFEDRNGHLWFGTEGGGLSRYDGEYFSHYKLDERREAGHIRSIEEDPDGNFWVATMTGLFYARFESEYSSKADQSSEAGTSPAIRIIRFDRTDGLKGLDFLENSVSLSRKDQLWWGTERSLTMLPLDRFDFVDEPPRLQLTGILLNQNFVDFQDSNDVDQYHLEAPDCVPFFNYPAQLEIPHFVQSLTFQYSAISRGAPSKLVYRHFLAGYDKTWSVSSTDNAAVYRNLTQGEYTFHVMVKGEAGRWSEPMTYQFLIHPPWWQTWWAYAFYGIFFIGIFYLIRRYELRRREIKHQREIEIARLEEKSKQAVKLLELDEIKSRFFTNISHEFRTPLTVISGMATQVKKNPERWVEKGIELIQRNSTHLLSLINQILDLRKLESDTLPLHLIQGNIVPYLKYISESFVSMAESKGIRIHFLTSIDKIQMDYDPDKMLQILSNLLSNAIKYTSGQGDVYVQLIVVENTNQSPTGPNSDRSLLLHVKDSGDGIAPEALPFIFDHFYQVDPGIYREGAPRSMGSGVGLALTKELVALMNGKIEVSSQLGEGSTFTLLFPITQEAMLQESTFSMKTRVVVPPVLNVSASEETTTSSAETGLLPSLLIVEDNPDVRLYLKACLEERYQLLTAVDGQEGIKQAVEQVPDLIVSDVMMPIKDGFTLCHTLKNDERTSHIPIVLLTAKADFDSKMIGLQKGADAYLAKPFQQEELLVRLEQLLALRKKLQEKYRNFSLADPSLATHELEMEDAFIQRARKVVMDHITEEEFGIIQLCHAMGVSRTQLHNKMKALTGTSTSTFVRSIRLQKARELLRTTNLHVSEVGYEVGINNSSYFSRIYAEAFGEAPRDSRKN